MGKLSVPDTVPESSSGASDELEAPPDYHALARQLADLGQQAARRAQQTGDGDLGRLAQRLGNCAASMFSDLNRPGRPSRQ